MDLLNLLFPVSCLECKKPGKYICDTCLSKVEVINRFDPLLNTISIFNYEGVIRKAIVKIKYNFAYDIAQELANAVVKNMKLNFKNVILIPIPLHKSRRNWRGFNQSEILGKLIAKNLSWEFNKDLLVRPIEGKNQVGLPQSDRVRNIRGKFAVNNEKALNFNHQFVIFDDVATTGSTIKEALKVLKSSGLKNVFGLTIAK